MRESQVKKKIKKILKQWVNFFISQCWLGNTLQNRK